MHLYMMYCRAVSRFRSKGQPAAAGRSPLEGGAGRPLPRAAGPRTFMNKFAGIAIAADVQAHNNIICDIVQVVAGRPR
jgi:hypothetical protein